MASSALCIPYENVKYFDIDLETNTPNYYPLECALARELAYVAGEDVLFESTLHGNDNFINVFISLTSEKDFLKIQKNIDLLIDAQEKLSLLYSNLEDSVINQISAVKAWREIENGKAKIRKIFLDTQKLILTSYFDNSINLAYTPKTLENYRNKLYLFKNLIRVTSK